MTDISRLPIAGMEILVRIPPGAGPYPIIFLLHGWTGDEKSMWVFTSKLPDKAIFIAPRGLHPAPLGGYSWHISQATRWPGIKDLVPAVEKLSQILTAQNFPTGDLSRINLVGFSQGAALALAFTLTYPRLVTSVAGLSGFLPEGIDDFAARKPLTGIRIFLAHGIRDELVPVQRARQAVEFLETAGAQVIYCEDDVGHKLSASCFRGLEVFFLG